jgi:hypothetical protein
MSWEGLFEAGTYVLLALSLIGTGFYALYRSKRLPEAKVSLTVCGAGFILVGVAWIIVPIILFR